MYSFVNYKPSEAEKFSFSAGYIMATPHSELDGWFDFFKYFVAVLIAHGHQRHFNDGQTKIMAYCRRQQPKVLVPVEAAK